jgi:hypothetical protein
MRYKITKSYRRIWFGQIDVKQLFEQALRSIYIYVHCLV